ncbi:MAG: hypothetical protein Q2306_01530 [Phytoplasma sp.]|uniref:hypothetical protein n=1 Tax=Phytoplasma sp. TaxID=2155 RepID=UPI002B4136B8|nr:hypothetical protein [Phytoplasma sp.]WRH06569.1 MAG: hypothetical protein Q2306_01530 [Phytoplasma sp.]
MKFKIKDKLLILSAIVICLFCLIMFIKANNVRDTDYKKHLDYEADFQTESPLFAVTKKQISGLNRKLIPKSLSTTVDDDSNYVNSISFEQAANINGKNIKLNSGDVFLKIEFYNYEMQKDLMKWFDIQIYMYDETSAAYLTELKMNKINGIYQFSENKYPKIELDNKTGDGNLKFKCIVTQTQPIKGNLSEHITQSLKNSQLKFVKSYQLVDSKGNSIDDKINTLVDQQ